MPDLDNRAASLVDFVADALDPKIRSALHAAWPGDLSVSVRSLGVHYAAPNRRRVWSRKWTLHDHTGNVVSVLLAVGEDQDRLIVITADSHTLAEVVPPWISHRWSDATDAVRQAFYDSVVAAVGRAVKEAHERRTDVVFRHVWNAAPASTRKG